MKAVRFLGVILVAIAQVTIFAFIWDFFVSAAAERGHELRGGVAPGLSFYYGWIFFGFIAFAGAIAAFLIRGRLFRWSLLAGMLAVWMLWSIPLIPEYPIRSATYLALGTFVFMIGNGVIVPLLRPSSGL